MFMPCTFGVTKNLGPINQKIWKQQKKDEEYAVNRYLLPLAAAKSRPTLKTLPSIVLFRLFEIMKYPFGLSYQQKTLKELKASKGFKELDEKNQKQIDFISKAVITTCVMGNNLQKKFPLLTMSECERILNKLYLSKLKEKSISL